MRIVFHEMLWSKKMGWRKRKRRKRKRRKRKRSERGMVMMVNIIRKISRFIVFFDVVVNLNF